MTQFPNFLLKAFLFSTLLAASLSAGELKEETSLFSRPSLGSSQIEILGAGTEFETTGDRVSSEGMKWTPIVVGGKAGYVVSSAIAPEGTPSAEADLSPKPKFFHMRFWVGDGLASINSYQNYLANDFSLGATAVLGVEQRVFFSLSAEHWGSAEYSSDSQILGIHRHSLFVEAGYHLIPASLYVLVRGGVSAIGVDSTYSDLIAQWTYGASLGLPIFRQGHFGLSTQLNYVYTPSVSTAADPYTSIVNAAFGVPSGTISSANVVSLQLLLNFYL